jgi:hypothetical protein
VNEQEADKIWKSRPDLSLQPLCRGLVFSSRWFSNEFEVLYCIAWRWLVALLLFRGNIPQLRRRVFTVPGTQHPQLCFRVKFFVRDCLIVLFHFSSRQTLANASRPQNTVPSLSIMIGLDLVSGLNFAAVSRPDFHVPASSSCAMLSGTPSMRCSTMP